MIPLSRPASTLRLEHLEERAVPATFAVASNILTVTLNTAGEALTWTAVPGAGATSNISVTGTSPAVDGGGLNGLVALNGNNATILPTVTSIVINDSANNGEVSFADSANNAYSQPFNITLNNPGSKLQFEDGTSTFASDFIGTAKTITAAATADSRLILSNGSSLTLSGTTATVLPSFVSVGGNLTVISAGAAGIIQRSVANDSGLHVTGNATFTATTAAGQFFTLNDGANSVKGSVLFNEAGGTITSIDWLNSYSLATAPNLSALASLASVTINHPDAALATPAISVSGGLTLGAFGDITQTGPISAGGSANIKVLGNSAITLNNVGNNFNSLSLNSPKSLQTVAITEANGISISSADLGRAGLSLNAVAGNIITTGSITQLPAAGAISTTSAAGTTVILGGSNSFGGTLTIGGTPTTVNISDSSPLASSSNLTLPGGVTALTLNYPGAAMVLGSFIPSSVTTLTANGLGVYQSAPIVLPAATLDVGGSGGPVLLANPANDFGSMRFSTAGGFDVSIADANSIIIGGGSLSQFGSGRLLISAPTGITQTNAITTAAGSTAVFKATSGAVTLTNAANAFAGRVEAAVGPAASLQITAAATLNLGNISTAAGVPATFTVTGGGNNVQQYPGTKLNLQGLTSFTAAGGTSNLTNPGNQLAGPLSLTSPGTFNVSASGDITLDTVSVPNLTVSAFNTTGTAGGNILQTANTITATATATFNAGLAGGNVTLTTAGNNFGTVAGRVNGAGNFSVADANNIVLGTMVLGNGALSVTAVINITQGGAGLRSSGTGLITLQSGTTRTISLTSAGNDFGGAVAILGSPSTLALFNRGNLDLGTAAPLVSASANLTLSAGKTLTLPTTPLAIATLNSDASKTLLKGTITASGAINIAGSKVISGTGQLGATSVTFNGDTTVGVPLIVTTTGGLAINGGIWTQGANSLSVSAGGLTVSGTDTRFVTSGNSSISLGTGNLLVVNSATFQVGTQAAVAETATVTTSGNIVFVDGSLQAGLGAATTDRLVQAGAGNVTLFPNSARFAGTGVATTSQPVISVTGGGTVTAGSMFADSFDPVSLDPVAYKAGSDVVIADYLTNTAVSIATGQAADADGKVTGYLKNGQAYSVSSSLGAAAGLVVLENVDSLGNERGLDIVLRNNTAASTLTISPVPSGNNGTGTILIHSIAVDGSGPVTITAPLGNLAGGAITTEGTLTALTLRNISLASIQTGGSTAGTTSITAKQIDRSTISVAGVISTLTAENVLSDSLTTTRITADKFGSIKVTGSTAQGAPPGDLYARLTTRSTTVATNLASVSVAGTLTGTWDIFGDIGSVTARISSGWNLGEIIAAGGSNARNPDGIRNVTTLLDIGQASVSPVNLTTTGNVKAFKTTDWTTGAGRFGSIGTLTTQTNPAVGANGDLTVGILVTGNNAGNAIGSFSIAGTYDMVSNQLLVRNGNIGSINVAKTLSGFITANTSATTGGITTLAAGTISGLTLDAKRIGTLAGVANLGLSQFGDIGSPGNTFTLRGNDGTAAKNAIGSLKAARNLGANTFNLLAGNLGSVSAGYRSSSNTFFLPDATSGRIGSFTVGESQTDKFTVESIGAVTAKGVPAAPASSTPLAGNLASLTLTAYRESGTVAGVGNVAAAGALSSASLTAPNGITSLAIGRAVSTVTINTDSPLAGNDVTGRVGSLKAGSISVLTLVGESIGAVTTTGYLTPESPTSSRTAGTLATSTFTLKGAGVLSGVAVGAVATDATISSVTIDAPFGVTSVAAKGSLSNLAVVADFLPLAPATIKPGYGKLGALSGYDFIVVNVLADSLGAVKSTANYPANARGSIGVSTFVARNTAATATGIASITTDGNFNNSSAVYSPSGLGSLSVNESLSAATIAAGYLGGKSIGSVKAGEVTSSVVMARQLGSVSVLGNLDPTSSLGGGVSGSFFNVFGNNAGVGLGTFTALGTVANTVFDITDGNLTSFTAARLRDSTIQVGARFTKGNTLAGGVVFGATDRMIGTLKLTAPVFGPSPTATDVRDGAGFRDSYIAAAKYGTVTVTNTAATSNGTTEAQGVAFRTSALVSGTINVGPFTVGDNTSLPGPSLFAKTGI